MSMMKQMRSTDLNPRTAVLSLVVLLLVTTGGIIGYMKFSNGNQGDSGLLAPRKHAVAKGAAAKKAQTSVFMQGDDITKAAYDKIVARNLFSAPAVKPEAAPAQGNAVSGVIPAFGDAPVEPFNPAQGPFTPTAAPPPNLACTGIVEVAGTIYALLENLDLQTAQYTRQGEDAFGCKLISIDTRSVTLTASGEPFTLNIGDNKQEVATVRPTTTTQNPAATPDPSGNTPPNGSAAGAANANPSEMQQRFNSGGTGRGGRPGRRGQ